MNPTETMTFQVGQCHYVYGTKHINKSCKRADTESLFSPDDRLLRTSLPGRFLAMVSGSTDLHWQCETGLAENTWATSSCDGNIGSDSVRHTLGKVMLPLKTRNESSKKLKSAWIMILWSVFKSVVHVSKNLALKFAHFRWTHITTALTQYWYCQSYPKPDFRAASGASPSRGDCEGSGCSRKSNELPKITMNSSETVYVHVIEATN